MDDTQPKSPKAKLDAAFAKYLEPHGSDESTPVYGLKFYPALTTAQKELPAAVFFCEEAQEITPGSRVYEGGLFVYLLASKDDEAPAVHDARLTFIQERLCDMETVKAALNYQGGEDNRPVKEFHLFGFFESKSKDDSAARRFGEALYYEVTFAPYDRI